MEEVLVNSPLVSILIPAYNAEKYLAQTLDSVLAQTWKHKEIIVVDDGSTDNTLAIAKSFEGEGIKILSKNNQGASCARNFAIKHSKGDYIQFLDADDLLSPEKIEAQVRILLKNPSKVAVCNTVHFFDGEDYLEKEKIEDSYFLFNTDDPVEFLINLYGGNGRGGMVQPNAWLVPRSIVEKAGPWNELLTVDDDGEYFCRVLLASNGVRVANEAVNYYRKFKERKNLSSQKAYGAMHSMLMAIELKVKHLLANTSDVRARKALARQYMEFAVVNYPQHKDLVYKALNEIKNLGGTDYTPIVGGRLLEIIKKCVGWKAAKRLSYMYRHLNR